MQPLALTPETPAPLLTICDGSRELLRLKVVDGRLTAQYDPTDLDDAARAFVDSLTGRLVSPVTD